MTFLVHIITPERSLPPISAEHVTLPAFDGEVGIRTGHAPFVCLLGAGKLVVREAAAPARTMTLSGGVAQVVKDDLVVLAESLLS